MITQTTNAQRPETLWTRLLDSRLIRLFLFLGAYIAAWVVLTEIRYSAEEAYLIALHGLVSFPFLPGGLFPFRWISGQEADMLMQLMLRFIPACIGGWLIYLGVSLPAIMLKRRWVFVAGYIAFVILLILSVRGFAT